MKQKEFSLNDAIVEMEINKHKWLESEKAGKDIGFIPAAIDWFHRYGNQWEEYYSKRLSHKSLFIERRAFRRFKLDTHALLVSASGLCSAKVIDLSFTGILCKTANSFEAGSKIRVYLKLGREKGQDLSCIATVERIFLPARSKVSEIFLRFEANIWQPLLGIP